MGRRPLSVPLTALVATGLLLVGFVVWRSRESVPGWDDARRATPTDVGTRSPATSVGRSLGAGEPTGGGAPATGVPTDAGAPAVTPTYPIPTRPPGGCGRVSGGEVTVVIRREGPRPACATVDGAQVVRVRNELDDEIVFVVGEVQETIGPGDTMALGRAGDVLGSGTNYFWMVGLPDLSGILERVG